MSNTWSTNKDINKLCKSLVKDGWELRQGRSSHILALHPNGVDKMTISHSPRDTNAIHKIERLMRDMKPCL